MELVQKQTVYRLKDFPLDQVKALKYFLALETGDEKCVSSTYENHQEKLFSADITVPIYKQIWLQDKVFDLVRKNYVLKKIEKKDLIATPGKFRFVIETTMGPNQEYHQVEEDFQNRNDAIKLCPAFDHDRSFLKPFYQIFNDEGLEQILDGAGIFMNYKK